MISKVGVIGAGVMGSGIAAQVANSGHKVVLLDIVDRTSDNRNTIVQRALDRMLTGKPAQLSHPSKIEFITTGNLEDNLELLRDCDLVIEVIVEKLEVKHQLYNKIAPYLKADAILSSNTSTLLLKDLKSGIEPLLRPRFIITHFFNPPRVMELLELVTNEETNSEVIKTIELFMTYGMGKTIVRCNDTPGFIANRIGCFLLEMVVRKAIEKNLDIVTIDYIFSDYLKLPGTGIFGLYDLIGHDVMRLISDSLTAKLPPDDAYHSIYRPITVLDEMRKKNLVGRKGAGGFYRLATDEKGKKIKKVIDTRTLTYKPAGAPQQAFQNIDGTSIYEMFISEVMFDFFLYVCNLVPEVTSSTEDIDQAMKLGYGWKFGPFALLDELPHSWFKNGLKERSIPMPEAVRQSTDIPLQKVNMSEILLKNGECELVEHKGNLRLNIRTNLNILTPLVFEQILASVDFAENEGRDLFIYPFSSNFSAGADLKFIAEKINNKNFKELEDYIVLGQKTMLRLKYSKSNIISCARGVALGGGCEILLHSDYIFAHLDLCAGLVEMSVGLIPGWGGIKEMVLRSNGDRDRLLANLRNIFTQNKSASADYFRIDYGLNNLTLMMHKVRLIPEGIEMKFPPKNQKHPKSITLPKVDLLEEFAPILDDDFKRNIATSLNNLLAVSKITEEELLAFEREKFIELARQPATLDKINAVFSR